MPPVSVLSPRTIRVTVQVWNNLHVKSIRALCTTANTKNNKSDKSASPPAADLRTERITVRVNSRNVSLDAVFQDTMPGGSKIGTVVAAHGALGSHKDFKYLLPPLKKAGIRLIGINFPGFGFTPDAAGLRHTNEERADYVQAIVDKLDLKEKVVFLGHSRGTENSLRLAARNPQSCVGLLLVNPMGLRPHRGVQPLFVIHASMFLWQFGSLTQWFLRPFLQWFCNSVLPFRVSSGQQAASALRLVTHAKFSSQKPIIAEMKKRPDIIVLVAYSGNDPQIETEISREVVDAFEATPEIVCNADGHDNSTASQEFDRLLREGRTKLAIQFVKDNHFLQKFRAVFLVDAISSILSKAK